MLGNETVFLLVLFHLLSKTEMKIHSLARRDHQPVQGVAAELVNSFVGRTLTSPHLTSHTHRSKRKRLD